jgi:FkbH-like protein
MTLSNNPRSWDARSCIRDAKQLLADRRGDDALELLRCAFHHDAFSDTDLYRVGGVIDACMGEGGTSGSLSVLIVGECTTSWVTPALRCEALVRGHRVSVREGGYDNIVQSIAIQAAVDVVIILPWSARAIRSGFGNAQQCIEDQLHAFRQAWSLAKAKGARVVQVAYDAIVAGPMGYHLGSRTGSRGLVGALNRALRDALPEDAFLVELPEIAAHMGRRAFYDQRGYYWTKQPFSPDGVALLARHLWSGVRAVTVGPKKVLVLDLDNTIWGGVVGELGALGVELGDSAEGEAYRAFQRYVLGLRKRGVILAVCSKNNPRDAREPFGSHAEMVLSLDDISCFDASWDSKPVAIQRIADTLRLGLDSFVFFDDNPAEREHVRQVFPAVEVAEVPADPSDYVMCLEEGLWFESLPVTTADLRRTEQYRQEAERRTVLDTAQSMQEYLKSLNMRAWACHLGDENMRRVTQLLGKTNQFNLTTRRHGEEIVRRLLSYPRSLGLAISLDDRFGEYGLISVVIGVPSEDDPGTLVLDTWLMSCRAIGRTVEEFVMNVVAREATRLGYDKVMGEYVKTKKNQQVADLFPRFGFEAVNDSAVDRFVLTLDAFGPLQTAVVAAGTIEDLSTHD